uniref:Uncharacterized protein n=1 Tax=Oncorhynchus tshawytscha TaxID=74940 RepID=A0A8C8C7F1_ONCTS
TPRMQLLASGFLHVELELKVHLRHLSFSEPVRYNPLAYTYCCCGQTIPFGCQPPVLCSQVPVGKVNHAHDWLKITGEVGHPPSEHPKEIRGHHALLCWEAVTKAKLEEQGVISLLST